MPEPPPEARITLARERDLLPAGYPYHPDWGTDWEEVDELLHRQDVDRDEAVTERKS